MWRRKFRLLIMALVLLTVLGIFSLSRNQDDNSYTRLRMEMVQKQLISRGITDERVLEAMRKVPRHLFVNETYRHLAYEDYPLPIEAQQTISQPYIVALMTQLLNLKKGEKVLEIGTGSGYQAAVLADLTHNVFSIEIVEALAIKASQTLHGLGYKQVQVKFGDGHAGWEEESPFDAIIITCATKQVPSVLFSQLREGGRMALPLGNPQTYQTLTLITKINGQPKTVKVLDVRFVPMTKK